MYILDFIVSNSAYNFGTLLTGLATSAGVITAWFQINSWKTQKLHTYQAEVAGKALTATLRMFQALDYLTSPMIDTPKDPAKELGPSKETYQGRQDYVDRLHATKDDLNNFFSVKNEAEVYLPDDVNKKLEELWKLWVSVKVDIRLHFDYIDSQIKNSHSVTVFENSFGGVGKEKRKILHSELKSLLKPIAKLEISG